MADEYSAKVIEGKWKETRRRRGFKYYFRLTVFLLVLVAVFTLYLYYKINSHHAQVPAVDKKFVLPKTAGIEPSPIKANEPAIAPSTMPTADVPDTENIKSDLKDLNSRLDDLEARDDNLTVYIAVSDLKNSLNNPENFKSALEVLKDAVSDMPEFAGKLDILQQASENGLMTDEKLLADLQKLKADLQNSRSSFSDNMRGILGNLVRVTKVRGGVDAHDYDSIIKRAELKLQKGNLSAGELNTMINEMANIGKPVDNFIKEANNLKRILEVTDSLNVSAKQKLLE